MLKSNGWIGGIRNGTEKKMSKFTNKSKYGVLVVNTTNADDMERLQRLALIYDIYWRGFTGKEKIFRFENYHHLYYLLGENSIEPIACLVHSDYLDTNFLSKSNWDGKVHTISEYDWLERFLKFNGISMPDYKPRKIIRTI